MEIRFAKLQDVEQLADVSIKTWKDTYLGLINEAFLDENRNEKIECFYSRIKNCKANILVCIIDNKIIGYADYGIYSDDDIKLENLGELNAIYILKEHQNKGIGKVFIKLMVEDLISKGYKSLVIWGLKDNPYTNFYKKIGGKVEYSRNFDIGNQSLLEIGYLYKNLEEFKESLA